MSAIRNPEGGMEEFPGYGGGGANWRDSCCMFCDFLPSSLFMSSEEEELEEETLRRRAFLGGNI